MPYNECPNCGFDEEDIFTPKSLDVDWKEHTRPVFVFNGLPYFYAIRQIDNLIFYCKSCRLYYKRRYEIDNICRGCLYYDQSTNFCYPFNWQICYNHEHFVQA